MTLAIDVSARFEADGTEPFDVAASLSVADGETLVVLGPSGSGKTLLLEVVAGLHPHEGTVSLDGTELQDRPPEGRDFGFVFQDYALFPHMTVRRNVAFGQRYRGGDRDPEALLAALGVAHLADRSPRTLSGGEAQRVALARALAVDPAVLLLDEPLSSLDVPTRQSLRTDMLDVLDGVTAVYVTHDRTTARTLADRIAVLRDGSVVQTGTPETVFERPASPFVARFTGSNCLAIDGSSLASALDRPADASYVAIRPEHVGLGAGSGGGASAGDVVASTDDDSDLDGEDVTVDATVEQVVREDAAARVTLALDGDQRLDAFADAPPAVGETTTVTLPSTHVTFL